MWSDLARSTSHQVIATQKFGPNGYADSIGVWGMAAPTSKISGANPAFEGAELVFGLVAPVGTNFDLFQNPLARHLQAYAYESNVVRLSALTSNFQVPPAPACGGTPEYCRLHESMHAGSYLRRASEKGELLALAAAKAIHDSRPQSDDRVLRRRVHLLRSLKHPDEVRALRRIYGDGFFLIGLNVDLDQRRLHLKNALGCSDPEIEKLLKRDEAEEDPQYFGSDGYDYGQRTRDTFHLADAFIPLEDEDELQRFLRLVFGCPFETPGQDEHAMFMAFAAALRSADLSRQVGAVVVSATGDLVSTGTNDVPRAQGGLYWRGEDDHRDHVLGEDSNERVRNEIVDDILQRLKPEGVAEQWVDSGRVKLKQSPVMDITEYGRAVHAEMEALLSCARSGCSPRGGTLYSTTFPCHNCAKHIVAAGIVRVVYVEPYPKSQATRLFRDSIRLPGRDTRPNDLRVLFEPFKGIGPHRFFDLFSMTLSSGTKAKRKAGSKKIDWSPAVANTRVPLLPNTYIDREVSATQELVALTSTIGDNSGKDHP